MHKYVPSSLTGTNWAGLAVIPLPQATVQCLNIPEVNLQKQIKLSSSILML